MADTDLSKPYKARITPDGGVAYEATIEYYHPDVLPPGPQPEPEPEPPPVIVLPPDPEAPPTPDPIPPPPEPPEVVGSARLILVWTSMKTWQWVVIPPPAFVKPPPGGVPKGPRR